ncbi:MAG TPA: hypothetical protein DCE44_05515, partial [Verrucomicrobiales bacterium]|nr:hypothetical protein [Verrucomicrobiales bacterium]
ADSTPVVPTTAGTDATPTRAEPVSAEPTSTPAAPARVTSKPDSTTIAPLPPLPVGSPRALAAQPRTTPRPSIPEPAPIPRYVVREGFVERTVSPQAPTDYELRGGFYREGLINYLLLEPQKDLRKFSGKRVMASGFEYSDSRWPTPVLKIQDIQLMP